MSGRSRRGRGYRRKRIESRSEYILKRVLIITGCILAVAVILIAAVKIVTIVGRNRLTKNANTDGPTLTGEADSVIQSDPVYSTVWKEGWVLLNDKVYEYNDEIRTFLVLGIDKAHKTGEIDYGELTAGGQSDGIFLVIVNSLDESIKILAVNRDTNVPILMVGLGENGEDVWTESEIAVQHGFGGGKEYSCELTRDAVSRLLFDVPIHGYAAISLNDIPKINDAVGGVTVTLPGDMDASELNKAWTPGATVTLNGNDAYTFVQNRDVDVFESARQRLARQKLYLKAFVKELREETKEDITLPVTIFNSVKENTVTDLTVDAIGYMASEYLSYSFNEDDVYTMEGKTITDDEGYEYFIPDEEALKELIVNLFYKEVDMSN